MAAGRPKARVSGSAESLSLTLDPTLTSSLGPAVEAGLEFGVELASADALILLRQRSGQTGFFAGTLSTLSLGEVFGQLLSGIRTGRLLVQHGSTRRTLFFRDAQLVFATSNARHERLGSILVQLKLVDDDTLKSALAEVKPGVKIGQVLIRRGELTQGALYSAMTFLVREIVVNLFEIEEGEFVFLEGTQLPSDSVKLPERTRELVLEGMKRGESVQRLRSRLPDLRVLGLGSNATGLDEPASLWARLKKGTATVGELRGICGGSDHAFLSLLEEQLRAGVLEERPETKPTGGTPVPAARSVPERYAELIHEVCETLQTSGVELDPLRSFLTEPQPGLEGAFVGVELTEDGAFDVARVLANFEAEGEALGRAMAYEALDAFVSYALFVARDVLPEELSAPLTDAYRAIQNEGG